MSYWLKNRGPLDAVVNQADLTMNGEGQSVALAANVKEGQGRVRVINKGATTEPIRVAFGASAAAAIAALGVESAAATTGIFIGAGADGYTSDPILDVPPSATHIAVANATASDTQAVGIEQGL